MFKPSSLSFFSPRWSAFAAAWLCVPVVGAQTPAPAPDDAALPRVVVTATRAASRADALVSDVTVLTAADIAAAGTLSLAELLGRQAGIQFSANGGAGQTSQIYLRGFEGRHTLLLVDGVRFGSATTGEPSLANLPLANIERIEIVRGPMASLYGGDAVGGVVQVFTRTGPAAGWQPNAAVTLGRYGKSQVSAGVAGGDGRLSLAVQVQHDEMSGFSATNARNPFSFNPDNDGYRQDSASTRLGWRLGGDWQLRASALNSEGTTDFDDGPGPRAVFRARNQALSTDLGGTVLQGWRSKLVLSRSRDGYNQLSVSSPFSELGEIGTTQRQVGWENTVDTAAGTLLLLAEQLHQNVDKPGALNYAVRERRINAFAVGLNGEAGVHRWQLSARQDRNSQYGSQTTGSLGYGLRVQPAWTLAGQIGTAFVAPSFNDLYWPNDGFSVGNPALKPTHSRSAELSLAYAGVDTQAKLTYHRSRLVDLIQWAETFPGSFFYTPQNVARAAIDGLSASWGTRWAGWQWQGNFDQLHARDADTGKQLARRARQTLRLSADQAVGAWRYGASLATTSGRWSDANNSQRLGGYTLADLRGDWQFARDWTLGARLNNAFDRRYETAYGYNQPGRALNLTLRYQGR